MRKLYMQMYSFMEGAIALDMKFIGRGREYLKDENAVHRFAEKLNHLGRKCLEKG